MTKLALLSLTLAACTHDLAAFDRVDAVQTGRDLDVLYVLDTSADHANYATMAGQLTDLATQLASVDGQLPSLHVAVTTADMGNQGVDDALPPPVFRNCAGRGDDGRLQNFEASITDKYLEDLRAADGTRIRNFEGDDDDALLNQIFELSNPQPGKVGCEVIQPMEAMRRALDPAVSSGFLRKKAQLMVVFLTNDDDCSLKTGSFLGPTGSNGARCASAGVVCIEGDPGDPGAYTGCRPRQESDLVVPVNTYVEFLSELKGGTRTDVIVNAVTGPGNTIVNVETGATGGLIADVCSGPGGGHKPAVRINSLVSEFGGTSTNGCTQTDAYKAIAQPFIDRTSSCFPDLRASDGNDCRVLEASGGDVVELPNCEDGGDGACWSLYTDENACPSGENIGMRIDRRGTPAPLATTIEATCFVK